MPGYTKVTRLPPIHNPVPLQCARRPWLIRPPFFSRLRPFCPVQSAVHNPEFSVPSCQVVVVYTCEQRPTGSPRDDKKDYDKENKNGRCLLSASTGGGLRHVDLRSFGMAGVSHEDEPNENLQTERDKLRSPKSRRFRTSRIMLANSNSHESHLLLSRSQCCPQKKAHDRYEHAPDGATPAVC